VVCGDAARLRGYADVGAPSTGWVFAPAIGLVAFWGFVLFQGRPSVEADAGIPFCEQHRDYWWRRAWPVLLGFLLLMVLMGIAMAVDPGALEHDANHKPHWMFGVAGCWMVLYLPLLISIQLSSMRPIANRHDSVKLTGAHEVFAEAVEGNSSR
jgi:hypothetical protein